MAKARLSGAFLDVRGRVGSEVLVLTSGGLAMRGRPKYKYPAKPAVQQGSERLRVANAAWNELTAEGARAWRAYAATLVRSSSSPGASSTPLAKNVFVGLACKFLQVSPGGTIPMTPPTTPFLGDRLEMEVVVVAGGLEIQASEPNSGGTTTEIMVQKLANPRRLPGPFYKSALFHEFTSSGESAFTALAAGSYALAYRFVEVATGQSVDPLLLGVVDVS